MTPSTETEVRRHLALWADVDVPPLPDLAGIEREGRARAARRRRWAAGAVAAAVAIVVLVSGFVAFRPGDGPPDPAPPVDSPPSPTPPTPPKSQSAQTWVDAAGVATYDGSNWSVPDPLTAARDGWRAVVTEHLDPQGGHLQRFESAPFGSAFEWPVEGSLYPVSGRIGVIVDGDEPNLFDGCRYLTRGPKPSNGSVSCGTERFRAPDGEPATISRWGRRCGAYEGGGPAPASCGDYEVAVAVERRDGLIGYVDVNGRGTPDFNPFTPAAMAAAAADPRLTLPERAFAVPTDQDVASVVEDHFPRYRREDQAFDVPDHPGLGQTWGRLGRLRLHVTVQPAGRPPACGRSYLVTCVERHVFGADDPTTVFIGAWDENHWASCCPNNSRATRRGFVYVGPRHTVILWEGLVVRADEDPVGAQLDQRLIDLALDPRLQ